MFPSFEVLSEMRESFDPAEPFIFHITVEAPRALQFAINAFPFMTLYWLSGLH